MKRFLPLCVLIFFSFGSSAQTHDIDILKKQNREFLNSLMNRDTAALSGILANDFILINPSGMRRTKADNLATLRLTNQTVNSIRVDSSDIKLLSDNVGLVTAWTSNVMTVDGKKMKLKICYQDAYVKRDGKWLAVAAHVTLLKQE